MPIQGMFKRKGIILHISESTVRGIRKSPYHIYEVVDGTWPVDWTGSSRGDEWVRPREYGQRKPREEGKESGQKHA